MNKSFANKKIMYSNKGTYIIYMRIKITFKKNNVFYEITLRSIKCVKSADVAGNKSLKEILQPK
jgi:hypothetical protein